MNRYKARLAGFSIIEVAIVVLVGGIVLATTASILTDYLRELKVSTTQNRMHDIDNGIIAYLNANGVLPCPASLTDAQDSASFGRQITTSPPYTAVTSAAYSPPFISINDCYASVSNAPTGTFAAINPTLPPLLPPAADGTPPIVSQGYIVIGAVPVRDINLPDQDIADAWGDRFVYAVSDVLTMPFGFNTSQGSIAVWNRSGTDITQPPNRGLYVILSLGADSAGSYTINGVQGIPCPGGGTSLEALNCNYPTATFRQAPQNLQSGHNMYDDYIIFHAQQNSSLTNTMPPSMVTTFSLTQCPPGWIAYIGDACLQPMNNTYVCCQKF